MKVLHRWIPYLLLVVGPFCLIDFANAQEASQDKGKWVVISDKLLSSTPVPPDFNGLPGNSLKTTGVAVDRTTGAIIVVLFRSQIFRSTDKGKTFERIDAGKVRGICQTGWSINIDPDNGNRIALFLIYGTSGLTLDGGRTWTTFDGGDFGAVDWAVAEPKVMMKVDHGGRTNLTRDAGKTWKIIGKDRESRENGSSVGLGIVDSEALGCCIERTARALNVAPTVARPGTRFPTSTQKVVSRWCSRVPSTG